MSLSLALVGLLAGGSVLPPAPAAPRLPSFSLPTVALPAPSVLRSPLLDADAAEHRRVVLRSAQQPAEGGGGAAAAPADDEPPIELIRQRERLTRTHRTLGITTFAAMSVTTLLGTIAAINQQTAFGPGHCSGPDGCLLGSFGGGGLDTLHGIFSAATIGLYGITGAFALAMPDPEHAMNGQDRRGLRMRIHRGLAYAHLVGMILQPILGFITVSGLGLSGASATTFSTVMRTTHLFVGYATYAAFTSAMITELVP